MRCSAGGRIAGSVLVPRLSFSGSKGERFYDWARVRLTRLEQPPWDHWLKKGSYAGNWVTA
jgi:hypothetical protein